MAVFPLQVFTQDGAKVHYDDVYRSSPLGIKFSGQPKGAYIGFLPSVLGTVLTLAPDLVHGYSIVKVDSNIHPGGMDIIVTDPITLDFVGQPDIDFPMNVVARVQYYDDGSVPTAGEVFSRSATVGVSDTEALLCVVDGPAGALTVAFDPVAQERDTPLAYNNINFGFMPGGSVESLQAAADIVDEVVAARLGLDNVEHSDLDTRISEDYGSVKMAERLALTFRSLRSNDYGIAAGEESVNVSGSFTEIDRDHEPKITLNGSGTETAEGAVASPNDAERNVALLVDATTGYRPVDDLTERRVVFGRLKGPTLIEVGGEWTFLNASTDVTGVNGQATVETEVGDTILGPDGDYYEIDAIPGNNLIELRAAFQGATETLAGTTIRRWELLLKKINAGNEEKSSLLANSTIRFFFPAFTSMERGNAGWNLAMHTAAEREPLPAATTTVTGVVRLAGSGSLLGSVSIQNVGAPLGGGPFHTINFNAANASVSASLGDPQEVVVNEIGPVGPPGLDGPSGGPGPSGGVGAGFSVLNPFEPSQEFGPGLGVAVPWSYTKDMGHNIRYLSGGVARWRDTGFFGSPDFDRLDILDVSTVSATEGQMSGTLGGTAGDVFLVAFLSSAGD